MNESPTTSHYVLVIHGTWNKPEAGTVKWYQLDTNNPNNFCHRLQQELSSGPLQGSVWRQCSVDPVELIEFSWSGDNTHDARQSAADKLCDLIWSIRRRDPQAQIHLVAHSHGGNVVLKALQLYMTRLREESRKIAETAKEAVNSGKPAAEALTEALEKECGTRLAGALRNLANDSLLPPLERIASRRERRKSLFKQIPSRSQISEIFSDRGPTSLDAASNWYESQESHRIGKLVFLGTPFYSKRWIPGNWFVRAFSLVYDFILTSAFMLFAVYWLICFYAGCLSLLSMFLVGFVGWNPLHWPWWLKGLWLVFSCFAAIGILLEGRRNVNLYFPLASNYFLTPPIPALVISAGLMDEALLALSVEPLVFGFMSPELYKRFAPRFWPQPPPKVSGEEGLLIASLRRGVFLAYFRVSSVFKAVGLWIVGRHLLRQSTNMILDVASGAGFGLPIEEFDNARVTASDTLELQDVIDAKPTVDVSQLFARTPPPVVPRSAARQLDFLWDDVQLAAAIQNSGTWKKLQSSLPEIRRRAGSVNADFERKLQMLCAMIDIRLREFGGMVELFHSGYYADKRVIQAIARFLESGTRPDFTGQNQIPQPPPQ